MKTLSETNWNAPYIEPNFVQIFLLILLMKYKLRKSNKSYASQTENVMFRGLDAVEALAEF